MKYINLLANIMCCLYIFTLTNAGGICRGRTTCRGLRDCASVMSLIETLHKPLKPSVVKFLRAQQCGFSDGFPKICCGVLPRNLKIFSLQKPNKASRRIKQHQIQLNRVPPIHATINKLSIYQREPINFAVKAPYFDITVSTAPPGASTVPYLKNIQREFSNSEISNVPEFLNKGEGYTDAVKDYEDNYDLQRTRRSWLGLEKYDDLNLDIEVR